MRRLAALFVLATLALLPLAAHADDASDREATLARLATTLTTYGPGIGVTNFHQSTKNAHNWAGTLTSGLKNAESLEIIVQVSDKNTINFRIYPHVNGGYMNIVKAKKAAAFRQRLLDLNGSNFMFWGADDTNDVFVGYTFTLESGYPEDAIRIVLRSIPLQDQYVGPMLVDL